jgi:hypothetical protein
VGRYVPEIVMCHVDSSGLIQRVLPPKQVT